MKEGLYRTKSQKNGFTVVELITVVALFLAAGIIFAFQWNSLQVSFRDSQRKTAINAIHYSLEEGYLTKEGNYPSKIEEDTLKTLDQAILKDPNGKMIGKSGSNYRYEPTGCDENNRCSGYTLRADLENEDDYIKKSRSNES